MDGERLREANALLDGFQQRAAGLRLIVDADEKNTGIAYRVDIIDEDRRRTVARMEDCPEAQLLARLLASGPGLVTEVRRLREGHSYAAVSLRTFLDKWGRDIPPDALGSLVSDLAAAEMYAGKSDIPPVWETSPEGT